MCLMDVYNIEKLLVPCIATLHIFVSQTAWDGSESMETQRLMEETINYTNRKKEHNG